LWLGQLASRIGDSIHEIALVWLIYEVTGNPVYLSITFVLSFVPTTFLSVPAGVLSDRVNRKYILVVSDLLRAVIVLSIPLVGVSPLLVPLIFLVSFVTGLIDAVDNPARMAMIPNLVPEEDLDSANSLSSLTFSASRVLLAVGGAAVAVFGSFTAFYLDSASFFVSAFFTFLIPTRYGVPNRDETENDETVDAEPKSSIASAVRKTIEDAKVVMHFISDHRILQNLILVTVTLQFVLGPITVALPMFVASTPYEGSMILGFVYAAFYSGMVFGSMFISYFSDRIEAYRGYLIVSGLAIFGVCMILAVRQVPHSVLEVAIMLSLVAAAGLMFATVSVSSSTLKQILVPDSKLGRYTSVITTVAGVGSIIGLGTTGLIVELIGSQRTIILDSTVALVIASFLLLQPIRKISKGVGPIETSQ
jgi:MFS family permease